MKEELGKEERGKREGAEKKKPVRRREKERRERERGVRVRCRPHDSHAATYLHSPSVAKQREARTQTWATKPDPPKRDTTTHTHTRERIFASSIRF